MNCSLLGFLVCSLQLLHILRWSKVNGDCFDPEVPKDGSRSSPEKHQFKTGAVIHYYCKANYTLVGSPKVLCLASGNWDTKPPSCIDPCGTCENNGKCVHRPSGNTYHCLCMLGYRGGRCEIPICLPPDKVYNGGFHVYQPDGGPKYDIGSELQFYCEDGYKISGINNNIKCILSTDGSAKWSRAFPVCKVRKCTNKWNGRMMSNGKYTPNKQEYSIGENVEFSCNAGFELHGASTVTCERSGMWSSVLWPHCSAKKCLSPPPILHGRVIQQSEDFPAGSSISFECLTGRGYYRFGPKQQICTATSNGDMVWHPPRPHCITRISYEQYCALQKKVFTLDPVPRCISLSQYSSGDKKPSTRSTSIDTLTIVTGTAGGLLGFLLVIIAFVIYQRRKLMRRMRRATSRRMRSSEDERMLIYCSNDFHFFLPTYDEAVNNRSEPTQPPSFDDVVNNGEQSNEGNASNTQGIDENTTSSPENTENEYDTIEDIQSSINIENTDNQRSGMNQANNDEDISVTGNIRTDRVSSEESLADENEPLV